MSRTFGDTEADREEKNIAQAAHDRAMAGQNKAAVSNERLSLRLDQSEKELADAIRDRGRSDYCGPPIWYLEEQVSILTELQRLRAEITPPVVEEAVKAEEHASPRPWTYRRREGGAGAGLGWGDWIEDANGSIVVERIGHIDGPFICAAVNIRARSATP